MCSFHIWHIFKANIWGMYVYACATYVVTSNNHVTRKTIHTSQTLFHIIGKDNLGTPKGLSNLRLVNRASGDALIYLFILVS